MFFDVIKVILSAILIAAASSVAKRHMLIGAILASIPLISVLAMVWFYADTQSASQVATFSKSIFWMVLPSLVLFISLPIFIKYNMHFYLALSLSIILTIISYFVMLYILRYFGIQ